MFCEDDIRLLKELLKEKKIVKKMCNTSLRFIKTLMKMI